MSEEGGERLDRFLNAAEGIKRELGRRYNTPFKGMGDAVRKASDAGFSPVVANRQQLDVLIELRNAIQHSHYKNGEPLAIPRQDAVESIERLAALVTTRPPIRKFMSMNPQVVRKTDSLHDVMKLVAGRDISQIPVVDDSNYVGILTTNSIARWLGASLERNGGELIEESVMVADVLSYSEKQDRAEFLGPNGPALDATQRLTRADGPVALLVTPSGRPSADITGIITRFDVGRIVNEHVVDFP